MKRWYVYAFKGNRLFAAYADYMNEPHVAHLVMTGWRVYRRRAK